MVRRWLRLCPLWKAYDGQTEPPTGEEISALVGLPERWAEIRQLLSHIRWFLRMIVEPMAGGLIRKMKFKAGLGRGDFGP